MIRSPGSGIKWLVTIVACVLVTYVLYPATSGEAPDACQQQLSAAAIADAGPDQEALVDNALLMRPQCDEADSD